MSFKLLWSIVLVNFKKNWIMILSFFVFLVISLSMFFGLTSYIIGFRSELPSEVFQKEKYSLNFDVYQLASTPNVLNDESYMMSEGTKVLSSYGLDVIKNGMNDVVKEAGAKPYLGLDHTKDLGPIDPHTGKPFQNTTQYDYFINVLINSETGILQNFINLDLQASKDINNGTNNHKQDYFDDHIGIKNDADKKAFGDNLNLLLNYTYNNWQGSNVIAYILYNYYFNVNQNFRGNVSIDMSSPYWKDISTTFHTATYIFSKKNKQQTDLFKTGIFETKKYINTDNVIYLSPNMESVKKYKLGQKISFDITDYRTQKPYTNTFIYGGQASYASTMQVVSDPSAHYYYIGNYNPEGEPKDANFIEKCSTSSNTHFTFVDTSKTRSRTEQIKYWQEVSTGKDGWLDGASLNLRKVFGSKQYDYVIYLVYTAMFSITIVFDVIMLVLDIVIAWFLIKEIIRSLSQELLFLKTLGMSNSESSLITSMTLLVILGLALCCGLVGMLGIQALFIHVTSKFVDMYTVWSSIQPYSLIAIFGAIIFLFATYYVVSTIVISHMRLADNAVINKSEFRFKKFTNFLFNRSINAGLTASFTIKNLNKIIVTFVIMFLISTLSFVALGFKDSITRNNDLQRKMVLNKDNLSYLNVPDYLYKRTNATEKNSSPFDSDKDNKPEDSDKTVPIIKYLNEGLESSNNLRLVVNGNPDPGSDIFNVVTGKFVYRNDLDNWFSGIINSKSKQWNAFRNKINYMLPPVKQFINKGYESFKKACKTYDELLDSQWQGADKNFTINFGSLFYKGTYGVNSFQLNNFGNDLRYSKDVLIVLNKNDSRYKEIFKDDTEPASVRNKGKDDEKFILPIVTSERELRNRDLNVGDYSADRTNIDYHIDGYFNVMPRLNVRYVATAPGLDYAGEDYVKSDDFIKWLDYSEDHDIPDQNNSGFYESLKADLRSGNKFNTFMDNNLPIVMHQIVVPSGYTTYDTKDSKGNATYTFRKNFIDYLRGFSQWGMNAGGSSLYTIWRNANQKILNPLITTMIVVLVLSIVLVLSFIVFMIMTIMNENDEIIFIMKALGYKRSEILWRITSGYLVSVAISIVLGIVIASVVLTAISPTFAKILFMELAVSASGPILGLFFALIVVMSAFVVGISSSYIGKRNLTVREE